jgi:hypothetical protein
MTISWKVMAWIAAFINLLSILFIIIVIKQYALVIVNGVLIYGIYLQWKVKDFSPHEHMRKVNIVIICTVFTIVVFSILKLLKFY